MTTPSYREEQEARARALEAEKTECYVCQLALSFPATRSAGVETTCPRCGIRNVLTTSGRANRPERIAIYLKYDGDPYNRNQPSLRSKMEAAFASELEKLQTDRDRGVIDAAAYRSAYGRFSRRREKERTALERAKRDELDPLLKEEQAIRERLLMDV